MSITYGYFSTLLVPVDSRLGRVSIECREQDLKAAERVH